MSASQPCVRQTEPTLFMFEEPGQHGATSELPRRQQRRRHLCKPGTAITFDDVARKVAQLASKRRMLAAWENEFRSLLVG